MYYTVKYSGTFGFIKPWTAVRDAETYSQQFLTPSIMEGMRQKLEVKEIVRHKLTYSGISPQQEVIQAKAWNKHGQKKNASYRKKHSIIKRGIMLYPVLYLAFSNIEDAEKAHIQHVCLCRNEDLLLPDGEIEALPEQEFNMIDGYELRFEKNEQSFMVGYNRFNENEQMFGRIEITGNPIQNPVW
jgi:hypothetical protein